MLREEAAVIYLDHAATSPMPLEVREAYVEALQLVGNPSSIHTAGQHARAVLDDARVRIAATLGIDAIELTFTGGGTEAVNLAIKGLYWARNAAPSTDARPRILVPRTEHHAALDTVEWLEAHEGATLTWLEVDELGRLSLDGLEEALGDGSDVALVTMLHANNEVGTLQPVAEAAALAAAVGVPVHVDAIAAYGQVRLDPLPHGVSAVSISAHKIGGPVGVGALALRRGSEVVPLLHGGGQQRGRSGTMDAAGAAAFAIAAERAHAELDDRAANKRMLRERLAAGIRQTVPTAVLRGAAGAAAVATELAHSAAASDPARAASHLARAAELDALALPGTLHFTVPGAEGDSLLMLLDARGIAASTGSACQAGVPEPSHVLLAMGLSEADARGALRITLGPATTVDEIDALLVALPEAVERAQAAGLAGQVPRLGRLP
ncbi:MAG: cysteine desulfurase NifS [Microbacterium sp.]|nr:cysteine desulfurase NifS [Microbacterium sp.]MBA4346533.1 cysteine desulfurase NifS [Microbacterium sp.]